MSHFHSLSSIHQSVQLICLLLSTHQTHSPMISHRSEISKRSITGQGGNRLKNQLMSHYPNRALQTRNEPPLQTGSFTREQPRIFIATATTTTTASSSYQYSHSRQQKAIACTSKRAKQIIESREYHQLNQTNQSILSHRSEAHQPQRQRRSNRSAPQWVCVCVRHNANQPPTNPNMANLKLPYGTCTQAAQKPEPIRLL